MISRRPTMAGKQIVADSLPNDPRGQAEQYRKALSLWLRWDSEHRRLTELMFAAGQDQERVEQLLDACESLKDRAVELSQSLLGPTESRE